ncbi:LOB DOMAIN-CONTAINING PROTEIN 21 [Salix koriyanagi]|uniref:LOB DOMAIN-CONTAINING PROTEIN 21 n=1 Tax=Salix koriyanagi TaxID=2511006 RepID=A0A9Q0WS91_9ROSI|nr:LOB DOMAIN-CONTAINING PROTEIN 21 [Salix koriyanagi]
MRNHEPRASSSCAACKFLKRRCTPNCIFAPYFRSDEPNKFVKVHKVFGASNVSKILIEVPEEQREDTVNSLAYEAEARLRDPVYGCIGAIALLQRKMVELQVDLAIARARLARYAANSPPILNDHGSMIPNFAEFPACGGLVDSFIQNSSDTMNEFQPIPIYILMDFSVFLSYCSCNVNKSEEFSFLVMFPIKN